MSKHRSDLTDAHSAFDFDVVTDAPRPFNVRRDLPADGPAGKPAEAPAAASAEPAHEAATK